LKTSIACCCAGLAMPQSGELEAAGDLAAQDLVGGVVVAEAALAREGAAVDEQALAVGGQLRLGGEAFERGPAVGEAQQGAPDEAEVVLQLELVTQHAGLHRPVAGLAEEAAVRDAAELAADRQHAAVERDLLAAVLELVHEAAPRADAPRQRRARAVLARLHRVSEAARILGESDHPHGHGVGHRRRPVGVDAVGVEPAGGQAQLAGGPERGPLGDEVHRAAGLAAAEQRRARALEHFHRLDPREVARAAEAAARVEAVHEVVARQVLVAYEAAQRERVPQAPEVVLPRHRCRQV